jgi:hypothetical protein
MTPIGMLTFLLFVVTFISASACVGIVIENYKIVRR